VSAPEQLRIGEPATPAGGGGPDAPAEQAVTDHPPSAATSPTPEQREAMETRDRDVFLEAGAGTGKTGVLVQRYCDAVTVDDVALDSVLAFTFTDKAAGELRGRIRRELARRAEDAGDEESARRLWRLARDTENAWISTIHGFCHRLLAAHPVAAGLDPRFGVLDQAEAEIVSERAFDAALEELAAGDPEVEALAAGFTVRRLRELVVPTYEKLRSQGAMRPRLPEMPDPRTPPRGADDDATGPDLTDAEADAAAEAYRCLRELLASFGGHYERMKAERSSLDFEDLQLNAVRLLREQPRIADGFRARFAHLMVDEFQDTNRLQLALIDELRGPETRRFVVGDEFQSIYGFRNADLDVFRAERERAGRADDDEVRVLSLTGNFRSTPEVIGAVNALGGALLEGFRPLEPARRMDPERPPPGPGPETPPVELLLTENDGWDADDIDLHRLAGEDTSPARVAEARALAARLRSLWEQGVPRSGMVVLIRAFTHVATYEEALERAGLTPYVVGGRGYWSHQQVEDMLRLLGCIANPLEDEVLFGALSSPAAGVSPDALWMLRQAARDDRDRARHVWPVLERAFGPEHGDGGSEPPDERARAWIDRIDELDAERLRRFCELTARLRALAPTLTLESLVDRTAREFGYDLAVLMRDRGAQRMANVRKLMRLARRFEAAEGRDLGGFLRYAEARSARGDREALAATEAEDHDGVRVMTIHAAKGLEFDVVAVPDLGRGLLAGVRWPAIQLGELGPTAETAEDEAGPERLGLRLPRPGQKSLTLWEFKQLQDEASAADAAEACRLIYVAATRARDRLLLSGTFTAKDLVECEPKSSHPALRRVLPALGFEGGETVLELESARIAVSVNRPSPQRAAELVQASNGRPDRAELEPGITPPLVAPSSAEPVAGHLSYAALELYERCGYRFYAERVLGLPRLEPGSEQPGTEALPDARSRRLAFGDAVHGLLEWSARNKWARPGRERCETMLSRGGHEPGEDEVERALALVDAWLGSELRTSLADARVRLRPEAPFMLSIGGSVVRGNIDLLAIVPGGDVTVLDYKTDALDGTDPASRAERYATQRAIYALAASRLSPDARVRTAYCFLEAPDRPVEHSFDAAALDAARAGVERLIAGVQAAKFDVTPTPHAGLCHDCPARLRLCSYDEEMTMRRLDR
jgi:ATP-dependent helicase/nuclease subunit A